MAAERAVQRWADDTERALRAKWDDPKTLSQLVGEVATDKRRTWWADRLRVVTRPHVDGFHRALNDRRAALTEQALTLLLAHDPRPGTRDLDQPSPALQSVLDGLGPATAAGRELLALAAASDAAVGELAGRATILDDLRTAKIVQVDAATVATKAALARIDQIEATLPRMRMPDAAQALLAPDFTARDALRRTVPDGTRAAADSDRALQEQLDRAGHDQRTNPSLQEQHRALAAPFTTALATAAELAAKVPALAALADTTLQAYESHINARDGDIRWNLERLIKTYGRPMTLVLCSMPSEDTEYLGIRLWQSRGSGLGMIEDEWPPDTRIEILAYVFWQLTLNKRAPEHLSGDVLQIKHRMENSPGGRPPTYTTPWRLFRT